MRLFNLNEEEILVIKQLRKITTSQQQAIQIAVQTLATSAEKDHDNVVSFVPKVA